MGIPAHITATALRAAAASVRGIDPAELRERVAALLASPTYRPPVLPTAAVKLLQLSQRPQVAFEEVARVLELDPVLAARVVSIAQSAAYSTRSPVKTLLQAVMRLGLRGVRDVVLEAALHMTVFRVRGYEAPMERLGRHSTASAHVVRAVCQRTRVDSEHAFLVGLLHDVGFAATLLAVCEDRALRETPFAELAPALDEIHEDASATLARTWGLPPPIPELLGGHHAVAIAGRPSPLLAAVIVGEQLAWEAGAGLEPPPEDADPLSTATPEPPHDGIDVNWTGLVDEARALLALDDLAMGALRAEAFRIVGQLFPASPAGAAPAGSRASG